MRISSAPHLIRHWPCVSSRGRGTVASRHGSHGDNGIPAPWLPLGPKDEDEGGCGEERDQEGPHGVRHGTTHWDGAAEKPTPYVVQCAHSELSQQGSAAIAARILHVGRLIVGSPLVRFAAWWPSTTLRNRRAAATYGLARL